MRFQKVVVGVDFSDASLAAARWVATHFAPDAEIVLVHVLPEPRIPSYVRPHLPPTAEIAAAVAPALHGGLRGLAELIGGDRARFEVLAGSPPDALAVIADETDADLICVGRGRRRRGSARFGATTAQRLLASTRVPTLVAPAARLGAPGQILAAVDERPGARYLFEAACGLGAAAEARVEALHVVEPELQTFVHAAREAREQRGDVRARGATNGRSGGSEARHAEWLRDRAREWVEAMLDDVATGASRAEPAIGFGDPGQEIIRHAGERAADLIVIGRGGDASQARLPAGALPLGSTTRLVLWAAPSPVLVLPLDASRELPAPLPPGRERRRHRPDVIELRAAMRHQPEPRPPAA